MSVAIKNLLTLAVIGLLLAGFLLFWDAQPEYFLRASQANSVLVADAPKADSYMVDVQSSKFSTKGELNYTMSAERSLFYRKGNYFELTSPHLVVFSDKIGEPPWEVTAQQGRIYNNGRRVALKDDVDMWQQLKAQQFNRLTTTQVTLWPKKKLAKSNAWVDISTPNGITRGKGMDADLAKQTFSLRSQVTGVHFGL